VKPPPPLPCIIWDQREQAPLKFSPAVTSERVLLPVGDYSIRGASDSVTIERKRNGEIQACCGIDRERFIEQMERMRPFPVRHLVIEGTWSEVSLGIARSNINPMSVVGTLIKIASDWNIPVWFAEDASGAALLVERILLREHKRLELAAKEAERAKRKAAQWASEPKR
jgi:ERCC4-type nuclease